MDLEGEILKDPNLKQKNVDICLVMCAMYEDLNYKIRSNPQHPLLKRQSARSSPVAFSQFLSSDIQMLT